MPAQNQIGDFPIIRLSPVPQGPREMSAVESYPGVNGHSYWLLGKKGQLVPHTTFVDCLSVAHAMYTLNEYQKTIGQRLPITYAGNEITDWRFQVIDVEVVDISPTLLQIGGTLGTKAGGATLIAQWALIPELQTAEAEA